MINLRQRNDIRNAVHARIRAKMSGTAERPRLNVYRSLNHIYTQLIDDANGVTIASASTITAKGADPRARLAATLRQPRKSARQSPKRGKAKGVKKVVFDRGGYLYHGRIKALADAAREAGLDF